MAGVEVIGVLASAGQLFHYSFALIDSLHAFYERVHTSPERYQRQVDQLTRLAHTVDFIRETESLNTPLVSSHLQAILTRIQNLDQLLTRCLRDAQAKTRIRLWKGLWTGKREDKIQEEFDGLQEIKSTLVLCVLGTYGKVLVPISQHTVTSVEQTIGERAVLQSESRNPREDCLGVCESTQQKNDMLQTRKASSSSAPKKTSVAKTSVSGLGEPTTGMHSAAVPERRYPAKNDIATRSKETVISKSFTSDPLQHTTGMHAAAGSEGEPSTSNEAAAKSGHSFVDIKSDKSIALLGNITDKESDGRTHLYQGLVFTSSKYIAGHISKDVVPASFFDMPK